MEKIEQIKNKTINLINIISIEMAREKWENEYNKIINIKNHQFQRLRNIINNIIFKGFNSFDELRY
jgi:hypothetical protein